MSSFLGLAPIDPHAADPSLDTQSKPGRVKADSGGAAPHPARISFAGSALLASLGADCSAALQRVMVRRRFANGQTIHLQDDDARFLDVIVTGYVRLSYVMADGSTILHAVLPSGDHFGEIGVFDRSVYPDMATAFGPVALVSLPAAPLLDLAQAHPELADALNRAVAARYRDYVALVRDLSLPSLPARLARTLVRLVDRLGRHGRHAQLIGAIVTQTDLGLMARGSRGNVNRALQAWQRAGWIAIEGRSIVVRDRCALLAVAADARD